MTEVRRRKQASKQRAILDLSSFDSIVFASNDSNVGRTKGGKARLGPYVKVILMPVQRGGAETQRNPTLCEVNLCLHGNFE
jgi:hypothetical protein